MAGMLLELLKEAVPKVGVMALCGIPELTRPHVPQKARELGHEICLSHPKQTRTRTTLCG